MRYVIEYATFQILTLDQRDILADWLDGHGVVGLDHIVELVVDEDEGQITVHRIVHDERGIARRDERTGELIVETDHVRLIDLFPTELGQLAVVWIVAVPNARRRLRVPAHYLPKEIHYIMSDVTVHDDQAPFNAHIQLVDGQGNPTEPDDVPAWSSSADNVARIAAVSDDGKSATIAVAALGSAQITVETNDANGTKIVLSGHVQVVAGNAVRGEITFDVANVDVPPAPVNIDPVPPAPEPEPEPAPEPEPEPAPEPVVVEEPAPPVDDGSHDFEPPPAEEPAPVEEPVVVDEPAPIGEPPVDAPVDTPDAAPEETPAPAPEPEITPDAVPDTPADETPTP